VRNGIDRSVADPKSAGRTVLGVLRKSLSGNPAGKDDHQPGLVLIAYWIFIVLSYRVRFQPATDGRLRLESLSFSPTSGNIIGGYGSGKLIARGMAGQGAGR